MSAGELPAAYGLAFPGLDDAGFMLRAAPGQWPEVRVTCQVDAPGLPHLPPEEHTLDRLERSSEAGRVILDRRERTARYFVPRPLHTSELVRPILDTAATAFARWEGHDVFHAGAFVGAAGVWAVVGESGAGKSTLLAALAVRGVPVVADDLLVVDDRAAYAGVRTVDLQPDAVARLGIADRVTPVGREGRLRLGLPDVTPRTALAGWVFLCWSKTSELVALSARETLSRVTGSHLWADVTSDPVRLLDFAALPGYELRRPRHADSLAASVALVADL
jgi:hypothetical protein